MLTVHRPHLVLILAALAALTIDLPSACAQRRITIGGSGINADDGDSDDDDDDNNRRSRRRRSNNDDDGSDETRNSSGNTAQQELQKFIQGGSGSSRTRPSFNQQGLPGQSQQGNENRQEFQGGDRTSRNRTAIKIGNWSSQYGNKVQPFSSKWYDEHPDAWRHSQPQADLWVNVPADGVAAWLGWGNTGPGGARLVVPGGGRAIGGRFDPSRYGEWLPLGVYMLMSSPEDNTRLVQLAVDRSGSLRGVYYDAIADASYNITGRMYRDSQEARWTLRSNRNVNFHARLSDLLSNYGRVRVYLPGGNQRWDLVRVER